VGVLLLCLNDSYVLVLSPQEHALWRQRQLEDELAAVEAEEAEAVSAARSSAQAALTRLVAEDAAADAAEEAALSARLEAVHAAVRDTGARAAGLLLAEEKLRQERLAAAAAKAAAESAAKAAAEAAAKAAAERAAKERADKEEAMRKAAADAAAARQAAAAAVPAPAAGHANGSGRTMPRATASAIAAEKELAAVLGAARGLAAPFVSDAGRKPARRQVEKQIVVAVQQISATREQVTRKATELATLLHAMAPGPELAHAMLWLVDKLLAQVETQVTRLPGFAFALADTATQTAQGIQRASDQHCQLLPLLLARMHETSVLCVPKVYVYIAGAWASEEAYFRALGYATTTSDNGSTSLETTDAFLSRTTSMCRFMGALMQSDAAPADGPLGNLAGLPGAWAYLARLLNGSPPGRDTGTALEAFLSMAGWRLHSAYGRQFLKVLGAVHTHYLPKLDAQPDAETRPVAVRLRVCVEGGAHLRPPEGRNMPLTDKSSTTL
jgi:nucleoporin GLE1